VCVIVDTNCFGSVLNTSAKDHKRFVPVYEWLMYGKGGRLVYGGTKYKKELDFRKKGYKRLILEIQRKGRLVSVNDAAVDKLAATVKAKVDDGDFDDEHLVAIVGVSKCCVVVSLDRRADPFFKRRDLYPDGVHPPKIYRNAKSKKLCGCEKHIAAICRDARGNR
jgi:predicted nucleic acid-binding protein